jgi:hypothetical protein|tara:strand:- start:360 stop:689 length:330 start_codon:yes stop_codon:yes gene_type:complete
MDAIRKSLRKQLLEKKHKGERPHIEREDVDVDIRHHDEESTLIMHEINTLNSKVQYLTSLNSDLVEFLHSLVKELEHDNNLEIGEARRSLTVLLNRSGRRKFYQQSKRI